MQKLVRDRIPELIREDGKDPDTYVADEKEYAALLREKLKEEVAEFLESERVEELADILEVIDALLVHKKIEKEELEVIKKKKHQERGGFQEKIVLR